MGRNHLKILRLKTPPPKSPHNNAKSPQTQPDLKTQQPQPYTNTNKRNQSTTNQVNGLKSHCYAQTQRVRSEKMDDKDLDDATLWAVINSAVASHSTSKSRKPFAIKSPYFQSLSPISNPSPPTKFHKYPRTPNSTVTDSRVSAQGEVLHEP